MSQIRTRSASTSSGELEDEFVAPYFKWPHVDRTFAPISESLNEAARLHFNPPHTTVPRAWKGMQVVSVVDKLYEGSFVLDLDDENFSDELGRMLSAGARELVVGTTDEVELGAPRIHVLLAAVDDLTAWTGMTKQSLSEFLGVSYSTVLSWRRERPERPRHQCIPTLLTLWSAVSGAQEEFGAEETARMVWAAGRTDAGLPAIPADELATKLLDETSEANLSEFLSDDGYGAGTAPVPDVQLLTAAEEQLHASLEDNRVQPSPAGR